MLRVIFGPSGWLLSLLLASCFPIVLGPAGNVGGISSNFGCSTSILSSCFISLVLFLIPEANKLPEYQKQLCPIDVDQTGGVSHIHLGHFPRGKVSAPFANYEEFEALVGNAHSLCQLHKVDMGIAKANCNGLTLYTALFESIRSTTSYVLSCENDLNLPGPKYPISRFSSDVVTFLLFCVLSFAEFCLLHCFLHGSSPLFQILRIGFSNNCFWLSKFDVN